MRAAGRLSAAIEILEELGSSGHPAGLALLKWARGHRFAGSKDRAAIANLVYDVLRKKAFYEAVMATGEPRPLALAAFLDSWDYNPEEIEGLCDGSKFAPAPLSDLERAGLQRLAKGELTGVSPMQRSNIPAWLFPSFEQSFGERAVAQGEALAQRASIDIRVNALAATLEDQSAKLAFANVTALESLDHGLRIAAMRGPDKGPRLEIEETGFLAGAFEIQDMGSQIVSILTGAKAGMKVLDLCAGSGGKTLAMAAQMENEGKIFAYDTDADRLRPINDRLKRAKVSNVKVMSASDEDHLISLYGKMDVVLVDAPCTGSGTWRRTPDTKWRLSADHLEARLLEQRAVLEQGAQAVKPGGRLIYVTCSMLAAENGEQVRAFLNANPSFAPVSAAKVWAETQSSPAPVSALEGTDWLQLTPADHGCDGFFIAILQKAD